MRRATVAVVSWRKLNAILTIVWLGMIPVAVFAGWVYSITFIGALQLYSIVSSHLSAWRSDVPNDDR